MCIRDRAKAEELETLLDKYVPGVEAMRTKLKKYDKTYKELTAENGSFFTIRNSILCIILAGFITFCIKLDQIKMSPSTDT